MEEKFCGFIDECSHMDQKCHKSICLGRKRLLEISKEHKDIVFENNAMRMSLRNIYNTIEILTQFKRMGDL